MKTANHEQKVTLNSEYECEIIIQPRLPFINGIFDLGPNELIACHAPHPHVCEHLHDHFPHMHIRYGFEIPRQSLIGVKSASLEVAMMIKVDHRVDCNPIFVGRGLRNEGICLRIAEQDVHWIQNDDVGKKATALFEGNGRKVPEGYYFSGFRTSDVSERKIWKYSREDLQRAIGSGLRADQHFQATWREPKDEPMEPYSVIICLSDDETYFHTFFELRPTVALGAF